MPLVSDDPLLQIAFSVYENKGVFALLLGSGLSRAAEIPTGWEITLDLIRRLATAQGVPEQSDWAAWYRDKVGKEPDYSGLLLELAASPEERRSILHSYIEPSEEDREEGKKTPTAAHYAIADLVRSGHIRVIITTNFDRLLENALRERGIEPTIVASVDALAGAEPITHTTCYILKLHGDYKDARILNTEAELDGYPEKYNALLDRILDEHGVIVSGWSGEWDNALRAAFLRAPNRRYSLYWAARGEIKDGAQQLIDHRRAQVVAITDADSFFTGLKERVETLDQSRRVNPLSLDLAINSAKRFLAKHEHRIQLEELFAEEMNKIFSQLNSSEFSSQASWDQDEYRIRVKKYEAMTERLACIAGIAGRWGDGTELQLILEVIQALHTDAKKVGSGVMAYLGLRSYPAVLVFTAYGLGLTRAARWNALHELFGAKLDRQSREPKRIVEALFLWAWDGTESNVWRHVEGLESRKTPLSDHLLALFSDWGKRFMALTPDIEVVFERFEFLGSLAFLEKHTAEEVEASLTADTMNGWTWMPVGRIAWRSSSAARLAAELQEEPLKSALLEAGFAKHETRFLEIFLRNFKRIAARISF